ncbi:hypothetical protein [Bartonella gliris]|uniref:hypothetical protein n=1 Tax=Bartonella gliris TaxID=3004109 RepID=UPI00295F1297|nr:hypothetical protein [Bartonella gliris]
MVVFKIRLFVKKEAKFSIMRIIIFIALSSVLILFACTKTNNLNQYNKLYQTNINKNYKDLEYREKVEIAKEYIEVFKKEIKPVIPTEYDKGQFWRYLIELRTDPPEFDILKHYHIMLVFCGRFADLWQENTKETTLVSNNLKRKLKAFQANAIKSDADWNNLEGIFFLAKRDRDLHDPMFEYAQKFLDSPTGISREEQIRGIEKMITQNSITRFKNTATVCALAVQVYRIMTRKER